MDGWKDGWMKSEITESIYLSGLDEGTYETKYIK